MRAGVQSSMMLMSFRASQHADQEGIFGGLMGLMKHEVMVDMLIMMLLMSVMRAFHGHGRWIWQWLIFVFDLMVYVYINSIIKCALKLGCDVLYHLTRVPPYIQHRLTMNWFSTSNVRDNAQPWPAVHFTLQPTHKLQYVIRLKYNFAFKAPILYSFSGS